MCRIMSWCQSFCARRLASISINLHIMAALFIFLLPESLLSPSVSARLWVNDILSCPVLFWSFSVVHLCNSSWGSELWWPSGATYGTSGSPVSLLEAFRNIAESSYKTRTGVVIPTAAMPFKHFGRAENDIMAFNNQSDPLVHVLGQFVLLNFLMINIIITNLKITL